MDFAVDHFTQRNNQNGLKQIFELFDTEKKGYITYTQFKQIFVHLKLNVEESNLKKLFKSALSDQTDKKADKLHLHDFERIM